MNKVSNTDIIVEGYEIFTVQNPDGYTVKITRNDRTIPSASLFVSDDTLSDTASSLKISQDKALDFFANMLVRMFFEEKERDEYPTTT